MRGQSVKWCGRLFQTTGATLWKKCSSTGLGRNTRPLCNYRFSLYVPDSQFRCMHLCQIFSYSQMVSSSTLKNAYNIYVSPLSQHPSCTPSLYHNVKVKQIESVKDEFTKGSVYLGHRAMKTDSTSDNDLL